MKDIRELNKKAFLTFVIFLTILSCTLIEPACLIIENESDFDITVNFNRGNKKEIFLEDGKGDFILVYPGELILEVSIKEIGYSKKYDLDILYLEKKKFVFSLK